MSKVLFPRYTERGELVWDEHIIHNIPPAHAERCWAIEARCEAKRIRDARVAAVYSR